MVDKDIKMRDVFELPLFVHFENERVFCVFDSAIYRIGEYGIQIDVTARDFGNGVVEKSIVTAINAYDANQERIKEIESIVSDQERRLDDKVKLSKFVDKANSVLSTENNNLKISVNHWRANHDNVVEKLRVFTCRPDLTINKQQEEINELKDLNEALKYQHESSLNLEIKAETLINSQRDHVNELSAMVNSLINTINTMERANIGDRMQIVIDVNNMNFTQCLANVKSDVAQECANKVGVSGLHPDDSASLLYDYSDKLREEK